MNSTKQKQVGSALIVAMIFLGVLTMIGVSVTLTSTSMLKIAVNSEDLNDTYWATNAGMNLFLSKTAVAGVVQAEGNGKDALLLTQSQSGVSKSLDANFLADVYADIYTNKIYGNGGGKKINVSVRQKAKGTICPRAQAGSSVTKITCDHFDITSSYEASSGYKPGVKMGIYREMIHSNSATHQDMDVSG